MKTNNDKRIGRTAAAILIGAVVSFGCYLWSRTPPESNHVSVGNFPENIVAENPVNEAKTGKTAAIRAEAIRRLPLGVHDAMLSEIARNDLFGMVRGAAVEKLTDANVLAEIAVSDDEPWIRAEATRKVSDKEVLAKLADDSSELVRRAAREALGR